MQILDMRLQDNNEGLSQALLQQIRQQLVNQPRPFVGGGIVQEFSGLLVRGNRADQVQIDAAEELGIGGQRSGS